jgi:hypothetical protein
MSGAPAAVARRARLPVRAFEPFAGPRRRGGHGDHDARRPAYAARPRGRERRASRGLSVVDQEHRPAANGDRLTAGVEEPHLPCELVCLSARRRAQTPSE